MTYFILNSQRERSLLASEIMVLSATLTGVPANALRSSPKSESKDPCFRCEIVSQLDRSDKKGLEMTGQLVSS
jgi:hypothetical protein